MVSSGRTALITGITGQDGSYLAELLLSRGYIVHGLVSPKVDGAATPAKNIAHIADRLTLHRGDLSEPETAAGLVQQLKPDELYHLAAQTFVSITPDKEPAMLQVNTAAVQALLAAVREHAAGCRMVLAASAEIFGDAAKSPQDEDTPLRPRSFYGITKAAAFQMTRLYRQVHGVRACSAILYNHESPRRPEQFVTRKISRTAVRIREGLESELRLGNLDAVRDWGHAAEYMDAMTRMVQAGCEQDYVIATGQPHTVRDFAAAAFTHLGLDWERYVVVDPSFYRPTERVPLVGCAQKALAELGWKPQVTFTDLIREMVENDVRALSACA